MTVTPIEQRTAAEVEMLAEIQRLRAALKGPEDFATWQEAFYAERLARVRAEQELLTMQVEGQVGDMDGWVLLDIAMQCAEKSPTSPSYTLEDVQGKLQYRPEKWVIDAMRGAIRWDRRMNRDAVKTDCSPAASNPR